MPAGNGYLSAEYAESLSFAGVPVAMPGSGGWLIRREIAGSPFKDAMGVYPYLCCSRWSGLADDLEALRDQVIAAVAVTDPFGEYDSALLARSFDRVRVHQPHFVIDTAVPIARHVKRSHYDTARRAMNKVSVSVVEDPTACAEEWLRLYDVLCRRHNIVGFRRFTPSALRQQLAVPGAVMFCAVAAGRTVGLDLWYVQDGRAHGHLAAFDDAGYKLRASYATKMSMVEYFRSRVAWINLGGSRAADDGLAAFKRGWATGTRDCWLCGRIFDAVAYQDLVQRARVLDDGSFFPEYRTNADF